MAAAADAVPALLPHGPSRWRAWTPGSSTSSARTARRRPPCPTCRAATAGCSSRLAGDTVAEAEAAAARAGRATPARWTPPCVTGATGAPRCGGSARTAPGWPAAPRPARRPGRAGRTPPSRPERLGAYLREFDALLAEHGLDGAGLRALRRRLRARPHRLPARAAHRSGSREFLLDAGALVAAHGGSMSGEHGDGRARSELLPLMYSPDGHRAFGRGQGHLRPRRLLNPGVIVAPGPARRRPAGARGRAAAPATWPSPTRTTAATSPPPCTAASASASAAPTPPPPAG